MVTSIAAWQDAQQPPVPAAPTAPEITEAPVAVEAQIGVPQTAEQVQALRARRSELSDQLISATNRRDDLVRELEELPANLQPGVQQRIELLDGRILSIEGEIATTGSQLAASTAIVDSRMGPFGSDSGDEQGFVVVILLILFVAFPLTLAWAKRLLRKPLPPPVESRLLTESAARLERLEHAVDSIAIEMERVSEGQRFMTRVLNGDGDRLPAGTGPTSREP